MKKQFCLFICMLLTLGACALAEGGQLPLAAALEAYLPTAGWGDYVASDLDGDGYNDTYMLIFVAATARPSTFPASVLTALPAWLATWPRYPQTPTP